MPFCKNCGTSLNDGVKFCPVCGTEIVASVNDVSADDVNEPVVSQPEAPAYVQPQEPVYTQPQAPVYTQPQEPVYSQPQAPVYTQPQEPVYSQPEAPVYSQPQEPVYSQPEAPVYAQPQEPVYTQPQAPVYAQPVYQSVNVAEPQPGLALPILSLVFSTIAMFFIILCSEANHSEEEVFSIFAVIFSITASPFGIVGLIKSIKGRKIPGIILAALGLTFVFVAFVTAIEFLS